MNAMEGIRNLRGSGKGALGLLLALIALTTMMTGCAAGPWFVRVYLENSGYARKDEAA
ncbi:MAG: hypothetical protein H6Q48_4747 [Deltaproteobacteria bacterium]|nr:hypothetical protein [Deltaproteobacteria bacterium]